MDEALKAVEHLVAQTLAEDHADCSPDVCEFVGKSAWGMSEVDIAASLITQRLFSAGWLRDEPELFVRRRIG